MATKRQRAAAKRNVKRAQAGARKLEVRGRSKMGKDELRRAIAAAKR